MRCRWIILLAIVGCKEAVPIERVELTARRATVLGKDTSRKLDDELIAKLRSLPEVVAVMPRRTLDFPAKGTASFDGQALTFEVGGFADGVGAGLVRGDARVTALFKDWEAQPPAASCDLQTPSACSAPDYEYCDRTDLRCHHRIPIVVSPTMLALYNDYARRHGLPNIDALASFIDARGVSALQFSIELGASTIDLGRPPAKLRTVEAMIVGSSKDARPVGLTMPIEYVERLNREFLGPEARAYSSLVVDVRSRAELEKSLDGLGLVLDDWEADRERVRQLAK